MNRTIFYMTTNVAFARDEKPERYRERNKYEDKKVKSY